MGYNIGLIYSFSLTHTHTINYINSVLIPASNKFTRRFSGFFFFQATFIIYFRLPIRHFFLYQPYKFGFVSIDPNCLISKRTILPPWIVTKLDSIIKIMFSTIVYFIDVFLKSLPVPCGSLSPDKRVSWCNNSDWRGNLFTSSF